MDGKIYLIGHDDRVIPLVEQSYATEDKLQGLLEKHPDLLAGDQINATAPRRWLLVSREYGVPGEEDGSGRWSLDHLFLDQDGIPTLVEVKRSSDPRARREVVAQMLDYAANGVAYWPVEKIRATFEARFESTAEAHQKVTELISMQPSDEADVEAFWSTVKLNLQAGRIRLLFVADVIPPELRRIIEFLNEQMDPAEVLAVEVRQFVGADVKALVPQVLGQTAKAQREKASRSSQGTLWNEATFFTELQTRYGNPTSETARRLHDWVKQEGLEVEWASGDTYGGFWINFAHKNTRRSFFKVDVSNHISAYTTHYAQPPAVFTKERWPELQKQMQVIGMTFPDSQSEYRIPSISIDSLASAQAFQRFTETVRWVIAQIKQH